MKKFLIIILNKNARCQDKHYVTAETFIDAIIKALKEYPQEDVDSETVRCHAGREL